MQWAYGVPKGSPLFFLSTYKAQYYFVVQAAKKAIWLSRMVEEADFKIRYSVSMQSDYQSAINWVLLEGLPRGQAKHLDVQVHYIRQLV